MHTTLNKIKKASNIPENEEERLKTFAKYDLEQLIEEDEFKSLTKLAAQISDKPMALINLVDSDRMWSLAGYEMELEDIARNETVCQYTILDDKQVEIEDLSRHPLFEDKEYVINEPKLRYYAGTPLKATDGNRIGSLCVYDKEANKMEAWQFESLQIIAEEIMARLDLRLSEKNLQKLNKQKDEVLQIVSHDMRNPLSAILGITKLIKEQNSENGKEIKEYMGMIEQSAEHLLKQVDELMNVSQIESGSLDLNPSPVNINESTRDIVDLHRSAAAVKKIDIKTELNAKENEKGWFDEIRYEQIIGNLVTNAIKFTREGGQVTVRVSYPEESEKSENTGLELQVKDNGIGIPEKFMDILFTKYGVHGREGTNGEKSIGLGLPFLKNLVDTHGGNISVDSEEEKGTAFTVFLPELRND